MKFVIAPDSFKGSMTAVEAALAIEKGIKRYMPHAETVLVPLSDGGEGTVDSLVAATHGRKVSATVTGPLGAPVQAEYGWLGDGDTCVIEMASASGIGLIPREKLNPLLTTTYGTGELIKKALDAGCRRFILGLGGSATNDGGTGMLQALGLRLLDASGANVGWGGEAIGAITRIDASGWDTRIAESQFIIASDVQNPLVGPSGASYVFGPQKGAAPQTADLLERNLWHWADLVAEVKGIRLHDRPGAGAGGGIGGACIAFLPTVQRRGIDVVTEYTGLLGALEGADAVFTGEGQVDFQTASGKAPMGVAQAAQQKKVPALVIAGSIGTGIEALYPYGVTSIHSIVNGPMTLDEAMRRGPELLAERAEQVARTFCHGK